MKAALVPFARVILFLVSITAAASGDSGFIFNGFRSAHLSLDGMASVAGDGLLMLTNATKHGKGHAFFRPLVSFRPDQYHPGGQVFSFSTTFVFAIVPQIAQVGGMGLAFVISPSKDFSAAFSSQFLGLFNTNNNGLFSNHIVAVEFDTLRDADFRDIDGNHAGIDVNGLFSINSKTAGYYDSGDRFQNLTILSGQSLQAWVDYDGSTMQLSVTLSPFNHPKPKRPLVSSIVNLSSIIFDSMYVGFSSSTGSVLSFTYVQGWSFSMNGTAQPLNLSALPQIPRITDRKSFDHRKRVMAICLTWLSALVVTTVALALAAFLRARRKKFAELFEDWEREYGPQRFSYKDLYRATGGFQDEFLLGIGGFGRVYRGFLQTSKKEVAIKRVSHDSWQGKREFVAEITSIGRLQHRNLVHFHGYCRREQELLLVYDFMPNGSLDRRLFGRDEPGLDWCQRLWVIKGIALGLQYLHEEWEKVVVHRDVKASNVLLDGELNGRLGDFGLARLYDHGTDPLSTRVVGTRGYMAPELSRFRKASTRTDVFAFGAFLLEVACGRRPIEPNVAEEEMVLVDWVLGNWRQESILRSMDGKLGGEYKAEEAELVLKLGLLCSHRWPAARPSMRQVVQVLDGDVPLPEFTPDANCLSGDSAGFSKWEVSGNGSQGGAATESVGTESILAEGR